MAGGRGLGGRWLEAVAGEGWLGAGGRRQVTGGWRRVAEDWLGEVAGGSGWRQVAGGRWLEAGLEVGGWRQAKPACSTRGILVRHGPRCRRIGRSCSLARTGSGSNQSPLHSGVRFQRRQRQQRQHLAAHACDECVLETHLANLSPASQALLLSGAGPHASRCITVSCRYMWMSHDVPSSSDLFRILL